MNKHKSKTIPTPVLSISQEPQSVTRTCFNHGCKETLTYDFKTPMTMEFATSLSHWLTVQGESIGINSDGKPEVYIDVKTFCSVKCLNEYLQTIISGYQHAEDKALMASFDSAYKGQA